MKTPGTEACSSLAAGIGSEATTGPESWSRSDCGSLEYKRKRALAKLRISSRPGTGSDDVIVVDAVLTGAPVGTVQAWDGRQPAGFRQHNRFDSWFWRSGSDRAGSRSESSSERGSRSTESRDGDSYPGPRSLPKYTVRSRKWCKESSPTWGRTAGGKPASWLVVLSHQSNLVDPVLWTGFRLSSTRPPPELCL